MILTICHLYNHPVVSGFLSCFCFHYCSASFLFCCLIICTYLKLFILPHPLHVLPCGRHCPAWYVDPEYLHFPCVSLHLLCLFCFASLVSCFFLIYFIVSKSLLSFRFSSISFCDHGTSSLFAHRTWSLVTVLFLLALILFHWSLHHHKYYL